jgi:hypothetical protein
LLEDVEAYGPVLAKSDAENTANGKSKMDSYTSTYSEAEAIGVKDNRYTTLAPTDLAAALAALNEASTVRGADYAKELARQQANDALDKEFTALVSSLNQTIEDYRATVTTSTAELKAQEEFVKERIADKAQKDQLPKVAELDAKITEAAFSVRHTTLSKLDIDIDWENYKKFLGAKAESLAEQILLMELVRSACCVMFLYTARCVSRGVRGHREPVQAV